MAMNVFPQRLFTKGDEPHPTKSIHYFSGKRDLLEELKKALQKDEWNELCDSPFGVFLRFHDLRFKWASRMVHFMLSMQLVCKKKQEIWCLVGVKPVRFSLNEFEKITGLDCKYVENLEYPDVEITDEIRAFWELLGLDLEVGPSYDVLLKAFGTCKRWKRENRIWLGYLAIYVTFIEAQHWATPSTAAIARQLLDPKAFHSYPWGRLAFKLLIASVKIADLTRSYQIEGFAQVLNVWILWAMPEVGAKYGEPVPNDPDPPLLAYNGSRGRKKVKTTIQKQTRINSFIEKHFDDMFPEWDNDEDDERVVNIVKAMFGHFDKRAWRWSPDHWANEGVLLSCNEDQPKKKVKGGKLEKGVKRKLEDELDGEGDKVTKRAKTSGVSEMFDHLEQQLDIGLNALAEFVKEGFLMLGNKIDELSKEITDLREVQEHITYVVP